MHIAVNAPQYKYTERQILQKLYIGKMGPVFHTFILTLTGYDPFKEKKFPYSWSKLG